MSEVMIVAALQLPFRCLAFAIGFFFYYMETAADWIIGVPNKTEYVRVGACKRCGTCCKLLALEMPMVIAKRDWFVAFLGWWHRVLFNFQFQGRDSRWLMYSCGYLVDGDEPKCRIYHFRHRLCRVYPHQRLYGHPKTHPDCGFKFVSRDGKPAFDEVLAEKRKSL